jgi:hypothetical protein
MITSVTFFSLLFTYTAPEETSNRSFTVSNICHQKVPGLDQKRNTGLNYSILAAISIKIVSLGMYIEIPSFFSTLQKQCGNHFL